MGWEKSETPDERMQPTLDRGLQTEDARDSRAPSFRDQWWRSQDMVAMVDHRGSCRVLERAFDASWGKHLPAINVIHLCVGWLTMVQDAIAHLLPWWLFSITLKGTSIEVEDVKVNALRLI